MINISPKMNILSAEEEIVVETNQSFSDFVGNQPLQTPVTITQGHIKSGQTDYATGTGFFLGYSGGEYKFSIGNSTDYLRWDGSNLSLLCSSANAIVIQYGSDILLEHGGDIKFTSVTAPTACTATLVATDVGNVDAGTHKYKITYVNETGETEIGAISNLVTTDATHKQVDLTAIPVSTSGSVTKRKIYRTKAGGSYYHLLTTIADNTTTTYTDNTADADLTGGLANYKENDTFGKILIDGIKSLSLGVDNTFIGHRSGESNTTGYENTAVGVKTLLSNTTGYSNTVIGTYALLSNTTGYENTANGYSALSANTTGYRNTANGMDALRSNTTGYRNTANGYSALSANTTGYRNTANGYSALSANTTGSSNVAIGHNSMLDSSGAFYNVAIGVDTLKNADATPSRDNTAIGNSALRENTSGQFNTAIGSQALLQNTSGDNNVSIGHNSLFSAGTFSNNIAIGYYSGTYETGSNAFYINNQNRTNTAGDKAKSLMYGVMAAAAADQKLTINALLNLSVTKTPATAGATGVTGDIAWDASYIYVCTATDTWKRAGIATW